MGYTEGYNAIADIYDKLNAEIDYGAWAAAYFLYWLLSMFMAYFPL